MRSAPTFVLGVAVTAIGSSVVVADLTSLSLSETGSVAVLASAAAILVAVVRQPWRPSPSEAGPSEPDGASLLDDDTLPGV
jgi:hypothetical protein